MRIVISELAPPTMLARLAEAATVIADERLWEEPERLKGALADADALIVRNKTQVNGALLEAAPKLKVIGRLGVGLDNIDLEVARARSVTVSSPRGANATAAAEYVFAAMFQVTRRIGDANASVRRGQWDRTGFTGSELAGKTLGIVGLGDIGVRLAYRARAFCMQVIAYAPSKRETAFPVVDLGVRLVPFDQLVRESDFISVHVPLSAETRHLFGLETFRAMKPTGWLINTARGGVVDERALAQALRAQFLAGAVLDVRESEPPPPGDPLAALPNAIMTPHVAGLTHESQARIGELVLEDVLRVLGGEQPLFAIA